MRIKKSIKDSYITNYNATKVSLLFLCVALCSSTFSIAFSQATIQDSLTKSIEEYRQNNIQEKLYLHTAKSLYITGEIIWFKAYAVDGHLHQPLDLSKVAYIEVINQEGHPVLQTKINLEEGYGYGTFIITNSINTGNYTLRAYTAWMKNFDAAFYFHQPITIVNTLRRPDWQKLRKESTYDFQLFPEGGNLVQGLESKIAFRLVDNDGKGQEAEGIILNSNNDTIQQFKTHQFGMGHFQMTPQKGQQYKAIARLQNGQMVSKELPLAFEQGTIMSLHPTGQEQISITVSSNTSDDVVFLLVHCRLIVMATSASKVVNGKATFTLNKNELGDGINRFTIFNKANQPLCERLYFNHPKNSLAVVAQTSKAVYTTREKVDITVQTLNSQQTPVSAQLSLSVHLNNDLQKSPVNSIESYLLLSSEIKGSIENPTYYFTEKDVNKEETLDNLMLINGWSRFKWEEIFKNPNQSFSYLPEYEGHIITATITDKKIGQPVNNTPYYLAVPGKRPYISYAVSNKAGTVQFVTKNTQGTHELILQAKEKTNNLYHITIANPFSASRTLSYMPSFELSESLQPQLATINMSTQIQNNFVFAKYQQFAMPAFFDSTAFFGQPDKTYYLDDYTRFTSMEEVMREYVAEVRVRKQEDGFHYEVKNTPYQTYFKNDPLVLLDGVPLFDINKIMAVDPLKIRKIDVVARKYFLGPLTFEGIVNYSTYDGNLEEVYPDAKALMMTYEGLQLKREFYSPVYETTEAKESRLPDFRNQLLWEPDLQTNSNGQQTVSFYTSDLPGEYAVTIQGLTANGLPGSTIIKFRVNK